MGDEPLASPEDDTPGVPASDGEEMDGQGFAAPSNLLLIAANLAPLYGVLFMGWDAFSIVFLYWLENLAVGFFAALRMLFNRRPEPFKWRQKAFLVPFFLVHYGGFAAGHGIFVFALFGKDAFGGDLDDMSWQTVWEIIRDQGLILPAAMLAASHAFSFVWNYLIKGECNRTFLMEEQARPYRRVVVLHIAIIGGGFLIQALGQPVLTLVLLVLLKTGMDLFTHSRSHGRAQAKEHSRLERLYRIAKSAGKAAAEGEVVDSLQQQYPGYVRDRRAEKHLSRTLGWMSLGGLGVMILGGVGLAFGASTEVLALKIAGGVVLALGLASFIVGVVLHNMRRRVHCPECGRLTELVETGMTPAEMSKWERLAAASGEVNAQQRWHVCHECKRYWLAFKHVRDTSS